MFPGRAEGERPAALIGEGRSGGGVGLDVLGMGAAPFYRRVAHDQLSRGSANFVDRAGISG